MRYVQVKVHWLGAHGNNLFTFRLGVESYTLWLSHYIFCMLEPRCLRSPSLLCRGLGFGPLGLRVYHDGTVPGVSGIRSYWYYGEVSSSS